MLTFPPEISRFPATAQAAKIERRGAGKKDGAPGWQQHFTAVGKPFR
jgi:hypothetical protein